jgi:Flp pilus assembly pilin Flp
MNERRISPLADETGSTAIEYGLIGAMITTALIGALLHMNAIVEALYAVVQGLETAI